MDIYNDILSDGLIKSIDIYKFERKMAMETSKWRTTSLAERPPYGYVFVDLTSYDETSPLPYDDVIDAMKVLLTRANTLGWFMSLGMVSTDSNTIKFKKIEDLATIKDRTIYEIRLQCEPKYDYEVFDISDMPQYMYHVTDQKYVPKIMKIGLTPRSKQKHSNHPDRIYLLDGTDGIDDILSGGLGDHIEKIALLKIDKSKLSSKIKFYVDPQFPVKGVYTYTNIPSNSIEVITDY